MKIVLSSLLLSLPSLIWLYISNNNEVRLYSLVNPLSFLLIVVTIIFIVLYFLLRDTKKTAVITAIISFFIVSFGSLVRFFESNTLILNAFSIGPRKLSLLLTTASVILSFYTIRKTRNIDRLLNALLFAGVLLITLPIITIVHQEISRPPVQKVVSDIKLIPKKGDSPDIYYLVIERYGNFQTLQKRYNYVSDLKQYLEKEQFYIADNATANYPHTSLSLASSLNLSYLNIDNAYLNGDQTHLFNAISDSTVYAFFRKNNYKLFYLGDSWQGTEHNPKADYNYNYYGPLPAFTRLFLDQTLFGAMHTKLRSIKLDGIEPYKIDKKESAEFKIKKLSTIVRSKVKKMVFTHLLITHEPYVFDQDGKPLNDRELAKIPHEKKYINHINYSNKILKRIISTIKKNKRPYIIVLQADEGPYTSKLREHVDKGSLVWSKVSDDTVKTHMSILNAYYFPRQDYDTLYSWVTPVNSFRVIFNQYFGQNLTLLKDKNYLNYDFDHLYSFKEINL